MLSTPRSLGFAAALALLGSIAPSSLAKDFSTTIPDESPVLLRQSGRLEPGDRVFEADSSLYDTYDFTGREGQTIRISLGALNFEPFLALLDGNGVQLFSSDTTELTLTLPASGLYTIVVNGRDRLSQGGYELTVRGLNADDAPALSAAVDRQPDFGSASLSQDVGWQAVGSSTVNAISLPVYRYVGDCPGGGVGRIAAAFRSTTTAPADGLEVEIRNVTAGIDDTPHPNITRDYDEGAISERAEIGFSANHIRVFIGRRAIAVMPGLNQFEYAIVDGDRVVEEGEFATRVVPTPSVVQRASQFRTEEYCRKGGSVGDCDREDLRVRYIEECPGTPYAIPREFEALFSELFD
ncbi:MAG: PPC domain-containing protein [Geitlerinemataceae cyanobacterium]